ncbi:MAG: DNA alkylation repair protein [Planctomycetota bacterium]
MKKTEVMQWLKENADERGIEHWKARGEKGSGLKSYGIGLTRLRKFAKQIGRDHKLALQLWKSPYYDAKVLGLLIDDPKLITREQAEGQVEELHGGYLSHVFSSCDATLAKSPMAFELACDWLKHTSPERRRCAYGLLYELSKRKPKGMDDAFLKQVVETIREEIHGEEMWVRESMNTALMGIGKRNLALNKVALKAAREIGPVDIDYGSDNACEPLDVVKHLANKDLKARLAAKSSP